MNPIENTLQVSLAVFSLVAMGSMTEGQACLGDQDTSDFAYASGGDIREIFLVEGSGIDPLAWTAGDGGRIRFSDDGGTTWTFQDTPTAQKLLDISFVDDGTSAANPVGGWACGVGGRLLQTVGDGSSGWTNIATPPLEDADLKPAVLWSVHFVPSWDGSWPDVGFVGGLWAFRYFDATEPQPDWKEISVTGLGGQTVELHNLEIYAIEVLGDDQSWIAFATAEHKRFPDGEAIGEDTLGSAVLLRTDILQGPGNWTIVYDFNSLEPTFEEPWDITFVSDLLTEQTGCVTGGAGTNLGCIFNTMDGGNTWTREDPIDMDPLVYNTLYGVAAIGGGEAISCGYAGEIWNRVPGSTTSSPILFDWDGVNTTNINSGMGVDQVSGLAYGPDPTTLGNSLFGIDTAGGTFSSGSLITIDTTTGNLLSSVPLSYLDHASLSDELNEFLASAHISCLTFVPSSLGGTPDSLVGVIDGRRLVKINLVGAEYGRVEPFVPELTSGEVFLIRSLAFDPTSGCLIGFEDETDLLIEIDYLTGSPVANPICAPAKKIKFPNGLPGEKRLEAIYGLGFDDVGNLYAADAGLDALFFVDLSIREATHVADLVAAGPSNSSVECLTYVSDEGKWFGVHRAGEAWELGLAQQSVPSQATPVTFTGPLEAAAAERNGSRNSWVGGTSSFLRHTSMPDDSTTWTSQIQGQCIPGGSELYEAQLRANGIAIFDTDANGKRQILLAGNSPKGQAIVRSEDGDFFEDVAAGQFTAANFTSVTTNGDSDAVAVGKKELLATSNDYGASWANISSGATSINYNDVEFRTNANGLDEYWAVGDESGDAKIYWSNDLSLGWNPMTTGFNVSGSFNALCFGTPNSSVIYIVGEDANGNALAVRGVETSPNTWQWCHDDDITGGALYGVTAGYLLSNPQQEVVYAVGADATVRAWEIGPTGTGSQSCPGGFEPVGNLPGFIANFTWDFTSIGFHSTRGELLIGSQSRVERVKRHGGRVYRFDGNAWSWTQARTAKSGIDFAFHEDTFGTVTAFMIGSLDGADADQDFGDFADTCLVRYEPE